MTNSDPIRLYRFALSGHCHRVQLLASLLGLEITLIDVDLPRGEHKSSAFLRKNPFGQVPVIEDGDLTLADSNAILVYLALRYDPTRRYLPEDPISQVRVQGWLSVAAGPLAHGPAALRVAKLFKRALDPALPTRMSEALFAVMDAELASSPFLVAGTPTLADIAMYTYTKVAPEGGLTLAPYLNVEAWLQRIEALPRFVPMPSTQAA